MATLNDIRSTFLNYFAKQGHEIVESGPLVPRNDPTLMFTNSGMVQFKNLFTGVEHRDYKRATTAQKCVRAGGKHNDLDNVGYTARHHTFFEMLGNFSFGDYFKKEAIPFAWELITKEFGIDKSRLLTTVYHTDDEAFEIWKKVGVPEDRIIRIDTSDNFWQMGPTGPCGPCTEIFYDHGDHIWGGPPGSADEDGDRFIEIWNVVFMQNEQFEDGSMKALDMQSIDTGMGLERIGALLQGSHDNYDTDLFKALIEASADVTNVDPYGDQNVHHRVIADHLRSTSFLIADGVMPSNDGRGYVLRRIMRRAMRHAHLLGAKDPVMHQLVPALVQQMGAAYPELGRAQALIQETLHLEENRFKQTLDRGLKLLDDELSGLDEGAPLPGEAAFKLYDTYGFPLDLTQDALREKGREVDTDGFDTAMAAQKAKARAAWSGSGESADSTLWFDIADEHGATDFLGYETESAEGQIQAIVKDGEIVREAGKGDSVQLILNQTPFYAESGGQVGDSGEIRLEGGALRVTDTKKAADVFIHFCEVTDGIVTVNAPAQLVVDHTRRSAIRANHSATHLLHEALREALGDHVAQRGSLNAEDRLRFDFSHGKALSAEELTQVSKDVNTYIRQNTPVETRIMTPDDARALGAQALFGEKYGDEVRVVSMGRAATGKGHDKQTYSIELCGGTHVKQTGDIGSFVILGDSASSAGVRRIEALTGAAASEYLEAEAGRMADVAAMLKALPSDVIDRIKALMDERKALQNEVSQLKQQVAMGGGASGGVETKEIGGKTFLGQALEGVSGKDLRGLIDAHKQKLGSGVILLIANDDGKVAVAAGVTDDLTGQVSAVDVLKAAVPAVGGKGGGGRPDMAQGGGKDFAGAEAAIAAAEQLLEG
ncbi:alanine--tRNA ligase [Phaeobacter gallaeciensis]|uniref:alanine--tRNA ligase n=1 Tax=Phaeobacter gallaeciensis TaxID=60890 RepID=UPI00237FA6B0|nr:alanine--tRNA ligase [Phaeobacter gallaeciensis]MDE4096530.1 alanine--tRNA ligase [Phaeobacter gallaeciensis]MDE4105341.1 alanine--tRNA ligase [Phaeobacter gallaeciensis]MDE4109797.1 alanine--tRNA ligase [Phaeobacter gallaeciensis]MDE4114265.1 alanine--tRNA ligase [Phaeobacter gallaeciensis]MDE4118732.1 alanine--tRNA ligase [Phaeobacter gallaeciensis]